MDVFSAARDVLKQGYLCDHCLGRQFAQLLSGFTNAERGRALRLGLAMDYGVKKFEVAEENFSGITMRKKGKNTPKNKQPASCVLCFNFFQRLDTTATMVAAAVKGYEFSTFAIGTKVRGRLAEAEEKLWEETGTEWCEPLNAEVNRELGKTVAKLLGKEPDEHNPEMMATVTLGEHETVEVFPRSVYISGGYKKLVRGISQSKWEKYKDSVEAQVARPFMKQTGAAGHAFHAAGREDVDARCLDWRPFVVELERPRKRLLDLQKGAAAIKRAGKVDVKDLRISDKQEVRRVKLLMPDKTYRVLASFERPLTRLDLKKLAQLNGITVDQQTPTRVMHRRADLNRKKRVKVVTAKLAGAKKLELTITGQAGLYAKELVTGDNGRTRPSVAELLGNKATILALDVIKIHI